MPALGRQDRSLSEAGTRKPWLLPMDSWRELIDLNQFEALLRAVAIVLPAAGVLLGLGVGWLRKAVAVTLVRGIAFGLLGPLVYGLWRFFAWMVRYDLVTGYCGLHKVSVLLLNVVVFALVGIGLGVLYGRLLRPAPGAPEPTGAPSATADQPSSGADKPRS